MDEFDVRAVDQGTAADEQVDQAPSVLAEERDITTEALAQRNSYGSQAEAPSTAGEDNVKEDVSVNKGVTVLVVTDVNGSDQIQNSGVEADQRHEQEEEAKHMLASESREELPDSELVSAGPRHEEEEAASRKLHDAASVKDDQQAAPQSRHDERERRNERGTNMVTDSLERAFSLIQGVFQCISRSLERVTQEDFRAAARQNIQMLASGNVTPLEQCVSSLLGECSGLSEQVFPCAATTPEGYDSDTPKPPPIVMIVDTPAGPYIRVVPNGLVDEAVKQGLVRDEDVQLQREFPFSQSKQSTKLA
ncbi:hypothetical protein TGPRC2_219170 [Toxoplasma gondii TgCatPRC2]|uniref:Uncharacterized protein n=5 Tax=Toxoplasma gondii TaxID=5811 RepID=A0A151HCT1_TOXGO|nr:hypothetical protein TGME49_219170 [Toxoplasma gondii ME49]KFH15748.1 hypothetical protein TGMAS_219170 [Toxoplasma gondii MAS]KYF48671.1 hypothetical protein TGARI_219170 [Toxoplasma gondii ARI]KYK67151.1 hypothetical protein TGPRC2_219170 [Toxoplasma gondii TgCatPRC2]PIM05028.1 hypothetical protein TGCOUG_219170 [Toxoplasma gondii COUG]EPT24630.1 hypothetical protein TGME49_219170 [Toxoplasma gondii ME49]|eukprot:XP_018634811.1 hypothetical protein TGME49_219170 [Toxoplasma gondii ME49]